MPRAARQSEQVSPGLQPPKCSAQTRRQGSPGSSILTSGTFSSFITVLLTPHWLQDLFLKRDGNPEGIYLWTPTPAEENETAVFAKYPTS